MLTPLLLALTLSACGGDETVDPRDSGPSGIDAGEASDGGGAMDARVLDGGSVGTDSGGGTDADDRVDSATGDAGCTPESDTELCTTAAAECGSLGATDRCGGARTADCGSCEGPAFLTCAGNACGCAEPPAPEYVSCLAAENAVRFTTGGVEQLWWTGGLSTGGITLPPCGAPSGYSLVSDTDLARGRVNLPGGPGPGQCWLYRLCARDSRCTDEWSTPLDVSFCAGGPGSTPVCGLVP